MFVELPIFKRTYVPTTYSITALARERERISQSQFVIPSCFSQQNGHWPLQVPWKDKLGLRYALSLSYQCSNAGCATTQPVWILYLFEAGFFSKKIQTVFVAFLASSGFSSQTKFYMLLRGEHIMQLTLPFFLRSCCARQCVL